MNGKIYQAKKSKFDIRLKKIQSCDKTKANRSAILELFIKPMQYLRRDFDATFGFILCNWYCFLSDSP